MSDGKKDTNLAHFAFNITELNYRYRNITNRINAFTLLQKGIGEIILIHVRKAGGTTLKNWFTKMQCDMNRNYCKNEKARDFREAFAQFHLIHLGTLTSQVMDKTKSNSIWVIPLRDPIMRILSQYDFEWKWLSAYGTYYDELMFDEKSFNEYNYWKHYEMDEQNQTERKKIEKYKYSGITLKQWLYRINVTELYTTRHSISKPIRVVNHMYINNYYLWIFCCDSKMCNINREFVQTGKIWQCLVDSMQLLLNFDLILITEWMNDIRSHLFVNKLFWNKIDFKTLERKFNQNRMNLPYPYHVKNRGKNLMISNKLMNELLELNKWDIIFYSYAKHIAYQRLQITKNENEFYSANREKLLNFKDDIRFKFDAIAPEFNKKIMTKDGSPINIERWRR